MKVELIPAMRLFLIKSNRVLKTHELLAEFIQRFNVSGSEAGYLIAQWAKGE